MAICQGCKTPCNCRFSEDGYFGGRPDLGRNFSTIQGRGTADNPFEISFLDQEQYRPRSAEFRVNDTNLPDDSVTTLIVLPGTSTLVYESPLYFMVRDPQGVEDYKYVQGNFFIFGASVTFAQTADSPDNARQLALKGMPCITVCCLSRTELE